MKYFSYHLSKFNPDRDILQIRFGRRQPAGLSRALIVDRMDPSIRMNVSMSYVERTRRERPI